MSDTPLIELRSLTKHFVLPSGLFGRNKMLLRAVDGVDLIIRRGETLGLVGESGCGKSTLARTLIRLFSRPPARCCSIASTSPSWGARWRPSRRMQMIFQDPMPPLNGRMTVRDLVAEPLEIAIGDAAGRRARADELLDRSGSTPPRHAPAPSPAVSASASVSPAPSLLPTS